MPASELDDDQWLANTRELRYQVELVPGPSDRQPVQLLRLDALVQTAREHHHVRTSRRLERSREAARIVRRRARPQNRLHFKPSLLYTLEWADEERRDAGVAPLHRSGGVAPRADQCDLRNTFRERERAVLLEQDDALDGCGARELLSIWGVDVCPPELAEGLGFGRVEVSEPAMSIIE